MFGWVIPYDSGDLEVELRGHGQPLFWCDAAQGHVWALVIVGSHPTGGVVPLLGRGVEVLLRQPLVAICTVEPLDVVVLLRFARLDVLDADAMPVRPGL
jgi:hypothetical protein